MAKIRVVVIHPDRLMRETMLASVGADTSDIEVVGCYGDTCHVVRDRHRRKLRSQVIVYQEQTADICEQ